MKCPTSPRKMRLIADQIRGLDINIALNILKTDRKESSGKMENYYFHVRLIGSKKIKIKLLKTQIFLLKKYMLILLEC